MTSFRAVARYQRGSTRRMRMVADMVRGKNVLAALDILRQTRKGSADLIARVIRSARANAEVQDEKKKLGINTDHLVVSKLEVDGGPIMRRFRPMSMGRSGRIRKRTSHITVELAEPAGLPGAQGEK